MKKSILFFYLGFFYVTRMAEDTVSEDKVAVGPTTCDTIDKAYNDTEIMDGKCVKSYFRTDIYDNEVEDEEKFQYLVDNYCANLQTQPISCDQYRNRKQYDDAALKMYQELYKKYQTAEVKPTVDCLGIARVVFCAYQYKYCDTTDGKESQVVCTFLCDTWLDRCPDETELYKKMCHNTRGERCSLAVSYAIIFQILLILTYL